MPPPEVVAQLLVEALDHGLGRLPQDLGQGLAGLAGGSYAAACQLMTTLDSMLDKLINGTI